jgi:branched-subunit amino acid ABC-type transport system permease component
MDQLIPAIGFGLITASILAIASVGFTLQFSVTNILNRAFGDIMTASAFAAYIANQAGVNIWICLVIAALFGAVFSMLINRLVYFQFVRRGTRLFGMIIVTIAVSLIIQNVLLAIFRPTFFSYQASQGSSYHFASMTFTASQLAIMGIAVVAMLCVHVLMTRTRLEFSALRIRGQPAVSSADPRRRRRVGGLFPSRRPDRPAKASPPAS